MSKSLLKSLWIIILISGCAAASRTGAHRDSHQGQPVIAQDDADRTASVPDLPFLNPADSLASKKPLSLMDLPQSQNGEIILSEGFYEGDFRSYCLQPGTPSPSSRDAYLQAPLAGYRKDIVESVLRNSLSRPDLDQRNIQLLLWSVVSGSDFSRLAPSVKSTARQLLTSKQVFALQGGWMGVVKTVAAAFPETGVNTAYNDMRQLFELGNSSYEAYERIAVLRQPSDIHHADYKIDQWYRQDDGFYVRYFPSSYQRVKMQIYVPAGLLDKDGKRNGNYMTFDPVTMMAVPANSNAQRLGIGAPVVEVVRKVIEIERRNPAPKPVAKPPVTRPASPHPGT